MLYDFPLSLSVIREKTGQDSFQLLTIEGDDFTQIKGLTEIANSLLGKYDNLDLYISSNNHDFGVYYGLEVLNDYFQDNPDIEDDSLIIAEELGYEI